MRLVSILTAALLAFALAGCGKQEQKKEEKKVEKKAAPAEEKKAEEAAPAAEEKAEEAAPAEEQVEEAAPAEEKVEEAAPAEEKAEEAAPAEEKKEEAPAAEEKKEAAVEKKAPVRAGKEDIQKRRQRIQEIYKLGRSKTEDDLVKLQEIISGEFQAFEKATAIRALGNAKKDDLVPALKTLAESKDLAVKSEAAILLYQWGEKDFSRPLLEKLLTQGVALRRAFFKGIQDGKYVYEDEAKDFFEKAMGAKQVHVRLDAALGLLHMEKSEAALKAFGDALADQDKEYVRLTAVSYLASARDVPEARALLEKAAEDSSAKVATRAKQILGTSVPKAPAPKPEAKPEEKPAEKPAAEAKPAEAASGGAAEAKPEEKPAEEKPAEEKKTEEAK